jgi:hypothetical protein
LGAIDHLERRKSEFSFAAISTEVTDISNWFEDEDWVPDHLWRTLVADRGPGGSHPPLWYHDACLYWLKKFQGKSGANVLYREKHSDMALEFLTRVINVGFTRRFASINGLGDHKYFGLVPENSKTGDSVVIFQGCSVPLVLRRSKQCSKNIGYWELVGECFVYGVMDGEAMMDTVLKTRLSEYELV